MCGLYKRVLFCKFLLHFNTLLEHCFMDTMGCETSFRCGHNSLTKFRRTSCNIASGIDTIMSTFLVLINFNTSLFINIYTKSLNQINTRHRSNSYKYTLSRNYSSIFCRHRLYCKLTIYLSYLSIVDNFHI